MKESTISLAKACLLAMKIREESYDKSAAKGAYKLSNFPDFSKFYQKTLEEASEEAAVEEGLDLYVGRLIYLALDGWWNDVEVWALCILACKKRLTEDDKVKADCGHIVKIGYICSTSKENPDKWICIACENEKYEYMGGPATRPKHP